MNAPLSIPQDAEAIHDLQWWISERERQGTDWRGLLLTVMRAAGVISPCDVCEREPCPTPSFCQLTREADKAAPKRREWNRPLPTPLVTIEAVKQVVRDGGLPALKEPATRERLSRCDDAARAEIDRWLQARKRAAT
jgi:hypothetical protein